MAYSFGGSCIILFLINLVPGLELRSTEEEEVMGIDDAEIGEFAVSSSLPLSLPFVIMTIIIILTFCHHHSMTTLKFVVTSHPTLTRTPTRNLSVLHQRCLLIQFKRKYRQSLTSFFLGFLAFFSHILHVRHEVYNDNNGITILNEVTIASSPTLP